MKQSLEPPRVFVTLGICAIFEFGHSSVFGTRHKVLGMCISPNPSLFMWDSVVSARTNKNGPVACLPQLFLTPRVKHPPAPLSSSHNTPPPYSSCSWKVVLDCRSTVPHWAELHCHRSQGFTTVTSVKKWHKNKNSNNLKGFAVLS